MRLTHQIAELTLSLSTSAYTDGDLMSDTQEVSDILLSNGGRATLDSVMVLDKDDQAGDFDIVVMNLNKSLGTENDTPNISDSNAESIVTTVSVAAADYIDLGGCQVASKGGLGRLIEGSSSSKSFYVGTISGATKTYTESGVVLKLGFKDIT